jgi:Leucine-rich repeat (LRR) protein
VPEELGNLSSLKMLCLTGSAMTGLMPSALGRMTALKQLWLNNNQLTGAIPEALGQLGALTVLNLYMNPFTSAPAVLKQLCRRGVEVWFDPGVHFTSR